MIDISAGSDQRISFSGLYEYKAPMDVPWRSGRYHQGDKHMTTSDVQFEKFESQLAELKAQVAKLEAKAADAGAEAMPAYLREIDELKEKFAKTEKQYDDVRKAQESASADVMDGLKSTWHDLGVAVGKAMGRFG
jgi:chromosome segregation ATPase